MRSSRILPLARIMKRCRSLIAIQYLYSSAGLITLALAQVCTSWGRPWEHTRAYRAGSDIRPASKPSNLVAWKRLGVGGGGVNPVTPGLKTKIPGKEKKSNRINSPETGILHFWKIITLTKFLKPYTIITFRVKSWSKNKNNFNK